MRKFILLSLVLFAVKLAGAQSGGPFSIVNAVTGSGGGSSTGGILAADGIIGQPGAGTGMNGGIYSLRSGFWQPNFAPTSAVVSVGGRVLTDAGAGLRNAVVTITGSGGVPRWTITSSLGYYVFDEVESGQTYIVEVQSKRYLFGPRIITVQADIAEVDFVAISATW